MKKTIFSLASLIVVISMSFVFVSDLKTTPEKAKLVTKKSNATSRELTSNNVFLEPEGEDILNQFQIINGKGKPKPPTKFRQGHAKPIKLSKNYLTHTKDGFEVKFKRPTNVPTASVYKGKVYVSGGFGSKQYYAFDAQSGEFIWGITLDDDGPSVAAIVGDIIVFNTESCTIFACNANTGEHLWSYWLGDPLMSMPTIANGKVFTAYPARYGGSYSKGNLYSPKLNHSSNKPNVKLGKNVKIRPSHVLAAFDLKTGKILWQKWIDGDVMSAPVARNNDLFVTTFTGSLLRFNQKTGKILSAKAVRATSAPVIHHQGLFVTKRAENKGEKTAESLSFMSHQKKQHTFKQNFAKKEAPYLDKKVQSKSSYKTQSLLMDSGNGFSAGAPANSGWKKAYENIGQSNVSSLQAFQGSRVLYYKGRSYATMGNELVCNNPKTGKQIWSLKLKGDMRKKGGFMGTPPIQVNNKIVIATFTGDVMIIDPKSGKTTQTYHLKHNIRYQPVIANGWIYTTTTDGRMIAVNTGNKQLTGWSTWGANVARSNNLSK
ncbi:hypothetical protein BKI52_17675 [marine bacterium AO1-C]|nr:hypothetical protein BKI52_17675 [marine bacterium AO1-C]